MIISPKPFSMRELLARVKAVLRRNQSTGKVDHTPVLSGPHGLELDEEGRTARMGDSELSLTRLEFDLLQHLALHRGQVLGREQLLSQAWGYDFVGETRAVDSAVKRLRKKLHAAHPGATFIETVRGLGYKMVR